MRPDPRASIDVWVDSRVNVHTYAAPPWTTTPPPVDYVIITVKVLCPAGATWTVSSSADSRSGTSDETFQLRINPAGDTLSASVSAPSGVNAAIAPASAPATPGASYTFYVSCGAVAYFSVVGDPAAWTVQSFIAAKGGEGEVHDVPINIKPGGDVLRINSNCSAEPQSVPVKPGDHVTFTTKCDYYAWIDVVALGGSPTWTISSSVDSKEGAGNATNLVLKLKGRVDTVTVKPEAGWIADPPSFTAYAGRHYTVYLRWNWTECRPHIAAVATLIADDGSQSWEGTATYSYTVDGNTLRIIFTMDVPPWAKFDSWEISYTSGYYTNFVKTAQNPAEVAVPCSGDTYVTAAAKAIVPPISVSISPVAAPSSPSCYVQWTLSWPGGSISGDTYNGPKSWSGKIYYPGIVTITGSVKLVNTAPGGLCNYAPWITPASAVVQPGQSANFQYGATDQGTTAEIIVTGADGLEQWRICSSAQCISGTTNYDGYIVLGHIIDTLTASVTSLVQGQICSIDPASIQVTSTVDSPPTKVYFKISCQVTGPG